jgi:hypothetical protein
MRLSSCGSSSMALQDTFNLPGTGAKKKAAQLMVLQENPLTCIKTYQPGCLNQPCSIARTSWKIEMIDRGATEKEDFFLNFYFGMILWGFRAYDNGDESEDAGDFPELGGWSGVFGGAGATRL